VTSNLPTTSGLPSATIAPEHRNASGILPHRSRRAAGATVAGSKQAFSESHESVSRLISETAHDLRAPLSTIREAVRLVRDEELGQLSSSQRECLSAAINQCNCAAHLVDEMVQSRQFDSGFPNVRRQWMSIDDLRQSVEATLQPWVIPREIRLLWDGPFGQGIHLYADATLLRRLLVNLASNAIRVSRDGRSVMIRADARPAQGVMAWSVVDQGDGISASDMELIAAEKVPARSIGGLGLMIGRQLAAAHFSKLRIESRLGTGTAVSFQTALGGPAAITARWFKWRSELAQRGGSQAMPSGKRVRNVMPAPPTGKLVSVAPTRRVRIDVPSETIDLGVADLQPAYHDQVYLTTVAVGAAIPAASADAFDSLLQRTMRMTELAYRTGRSNWVIVWDADEQTGIAKRSDLVRLVQDELDDLRMTWGNHSIVSASMNPVSGAALPVRLSDLIVRESLSAAQQSFPSADQYHLVTDPVRPSSVAASRLDRDVSWFHQTRR
jgi:anti-sigma regulatory factor (Ser/Thr protein kinase)